MNLFRDIFVYSISCVSIEQSTVL